MLVELFVEPDDEALGVVEEPDEALGLVVELEPFLLLLVAPVDALLCSFSMASNSLLLSFPSWSLSALSKSRMLTRADSRELDVAPPEEALSEEDMLPEDLVLLLCDAEGLVVLDWSPAAKAETVANARSEKATANGLITCMNISFSQ